MNKPKQIIVLRTDLNMRKGKMVAQGAHASLGAVMSFAKKQNYDTLGVPRYERSRWIIDLVSDDPVALWLSEKFTKICVGVNSYAELLELKFQADEKDIANCLITDSGDTEFKGIPTVTALAIGPDWSDRIDIITGHLKLL